MTAKRFITRNGVFYTDTKTGYEFQCYGEVANMMNELADENERLKQELFETSKELLWATSDEVDRALHYEEEVEELRKEIFE